MIASVLWPNDNTYYSETVKHLPRDGKETVHFVDGDEERLNPSTVSWHFTAAVNASTSRTVYPRINDSESVELQRMVPRSGNRTFMKHEAQASEQITMQNGFDAEE